MRIKVLFFAQLQDIFQEKERFVEVKEGTTTQELTRSIIQESGDERLHDLPIRCVVNETLEDDNHELKDQDVFALITPLSGG